MVYVRDVASVRTRSWSRRPGHSDQFDRLASCSSRPLRYRHDWLSLRRGVQFPNALPSCNWQLAAPACSERISKWRPSVRVNLAISAPGIFPTVIVAEHPDDPVTSTLIRRAASPKVDVCTNPELVKVAARSPPPKDFPSFPTPSWLPAPRPEPALIRTKPLPAELTYMVHWYGTDTSRNSPPLTLWLCCSVQETVNDLLRRLSGAAPIADEAQIATKTPDRRPPRIARIVPSNKLLQVTNLQWLQFGVNGRALLRISEPDVWSR
jgi:hypothetical protein